VALAAETPPADVKSAPQGISRTASFLALADLHRCILWGRHGLGSGGSASRCEIGPTGYFSHLVIFGAGRPARVILWGRLHVGSEALPIDEQAVAKPQRRNAWRNRCLPPVATTR